MPRLFTGIEIPAEIREEIGAHSLTEDEWQDFLAQHGPEMLPPDQEG